MSYLGQHFFIQCLQQDMVKILKGSPGIMSYNMEDGRRSYWCSRSSQSCVHKQAKISATLLLLLLPIYNSSVDAWDCICVLEDGYASSLYQEKYLNAFFIPLEYKCLVLTSEIFCLWGKLKSLVLVGLGIHKFLEKYNF